MHLTFTLQTLQTFYFITCSNYCCVRQVGLLSAAGVDSWEDLFLVREDRNELTSGLSAVPPGAPQSS